MDREIDHLLLTRFNVAHRELRDWAFMGLDNDWLNHRLPFFENVCAPSVAAQTTSEFRWLVFVHPNTPMPFRERILTATAAAGGHVVFSDHGSAEEVAGHLEGGRELVVTTRLDCDDAISRRHIEHVQVQAVQGAVPFFVNFTYGVLLLWHTGIFVQRHRSRSPFLSFVEPATARPTTVWGFGTHVFLDDAPAVRDVQTSAPMWLATIHGRNVANPVLYTRPCRRHDIIGFFGLDAGVIPSSSPLKVALHYAKRLRSSAKRRLESGRR